MPIGPFVPYLIVQGITVALALVVGWSHRASLGLCTSGYRAQLLAPWRLVLFAIALVTFALGAPYMGDPTWDAVDATFMSVGCYASAPWVTGVVFRSLGRARARRPGRAETFVAAVAWIAVTSWSYDAYLVARDGLYPVTFRENAIASTILFVLGGLFFSVGGHPVRGVIFVFMDPRWPAWSGEPWTPRQALGAALLLLALMAPVVVFMAWAFDA